MSTLLTISPPSFATGYCWTDPQTFANDFASGASVVFGGDMNIFNYGDSTPSAANQVYPWLRKIGDYPDRWYVYYNGQWLAKHEIPYSSNYRAMWVGTTTELLTFDGGMNEAVGIDGWTGPFWEVDTEFAAKSPMGPGTLATSGTVVSVATNYGDEKHTLTEAQLPSHDHGSPTDAGVQAFLTWNPSTTGGAYNISGGGAAQMGTSATSTALAGSGEAHSSLHPVRGIYTIKRTARIYRKV